ncbi:hypothetical protein CMK11_06890 [Candidatus Poribacteria bacterium]|nr:hypothetical protein [Candidatus Poribacteria bacterium]
MLSLSHWLAQGAIGLAVSGALGGVACLVGSIDRRGLAAGVCVGTAVYVGVGWRGFLCLATFFVIGTLATRVGRVDKAPHGARTVRHVLANGAVPAGCALAALLFPNHVEALSGAFAGALAAATADTLSSEIGQVYGGAPYLLTTLRRVPVGENGGVTVVGTGAGLAGAAVLAIVAVSLGVANSMAAVVVAGAVGNVADSALGATLERRGVMSNAGVNVACTVAGAVAAGLLTVAALAR